MYIVFEEKDYMAIAKMISESRIEDGTDSIEMQGLEFEVTFTKEVDGYYEDGYENGTGAWVTTSAYIRVMNIRCDGIEIDYSGRKLKSITEDFIMN